MAAIMLMLMLSEVNVFIGLFFFYMIPLEMWIIDMLFKYMFGKKATLIKVIYYIINVCIMVVMTIRPQLSNTKLSLMALFPLTQFNAFGNLVIKALNSGTNITFSNISEPVLYDFSMLTLITLTGCVILVLFLLFLYLIPLMVAVDEDNPLKWYYPCVCGCLNRRRQSVE